MRRFALPLVAIALAGCWVPVERGRQMERRIQRLEEENALVTRQLDEQRSLIQDRVAKADAKIAEVQRKLDELNATAHRTGADVGVRQEQLAQELAQLRGRLEEEQHRLLQLDQKLVEQKQETDGKFAALRGAGALDQFEARRKLAELKRPADAPGLLALAREQEQAGEKGVARELYEEVARKWPKDPAAADAHLRLGELASAEGKHREAVLAFGKVAQDFPRSERAPEAMLRTGDSLLALGMRDEAAGVWRELQAKYPKAPAARAAREKLDDLEPPRKVNLGPKPAAKKR